jgi:hypothetical protein
MNTQKLHSVTRQKALGLLMMTALTLPMVAQDEKPKDEKNPERIEIQFDVAEDMNKFVEHRTAVGVEPVPGSQFVTEGNIFPQSTIPTRNDSGATFDPNQHGRMGGWFCKGVFLVKGSEFDKSPVAVLSDQVYVLPGGTISTTGTEGNDVAVRMVTGGTGRYVGYTGEQRQKFLGFNKSGGVNLQVTISLRKVTQQ